MKKFFAILLASIMVLSLVPASIFAADELKCPGVDETHDAKNCDAVAVETVDAKCNEWGYTVYQCLTCNSEYLDDFVKGTDGDHDWVEDTEKYVEPVCGPEAKDGMKYYTCSICGEPKEEKIEPKHSYELISESGFGCTVEKVYECTVCGDTYTEEAHDHEWDTRPSKIIDEPGLPELYGGSMEIEGINGLAEYTCVKCGDTKRVVIFYEHDCNYNLIVEAKEPDCDDFGNYAIYQCSLCNTLYQLLREANATTGAEAIYAARESEEDFIREPYGHDFPEPDDNDYSIEVGDCHVECRVCGEKNADEDVIHGDFRKIAENTASCTTYGFEVWGCKNCGVTVIVKDKSQPAKGHVKVTVTLPSTCVSKGYTITYCAAEWHDEGKAGELKDGKCEWIDEIVDGKLTGKQIYVHVFEKTVFEDYAPNNHADPKVEIIKDPTCEAKGLEIHYCPACEWVSKPIETEAKGHDYYDVEDGDVIFHNPIKSEAADCLNDGYVIAKCKDCEAVEKFILEATGHDYVVTQKVTNCNGDYAGCYVYEWKKCQICGDVVHGGVNTLETPLPSVFDTIEDVLAVHGQHIFKYDGNGTLKEDVHTHTGFTPGTIYKAPTCISDGYETFYCKDCGAGIYVTIPAAEHDNVVKHDATPKQCYVDGNIEYYECDICGLFAYEDGKPYSIKLEDTVVKASHGSLVKYSAIAPTCTTPGRVEYWQCKDCLECYFDKDLTKFFTTYTELKEIPLTAVIWYNFLVSGEYLEALGHDEVVVGKIEPTCGEIGYWGYTYCKRCGEVLVNDDKVTVLKDNKGKITGYEPHEIPMLKHNDGTAIVLRDHNSNTCGVFCNSYHHDVDCFFSLYKHHECVLCGYEYIDTYSPNTNGHVNSDGEQLTENCTNIVEGDRYCAICGEYIDNPHKLDSTYVPPTCLDYGYWIEYCLEPGCDHRVVIEDDINEPGPAYHDYQVVDSVRPSYVNKGYTRSVCSHCGDEKEVWTDALNGVQYYVDAAEGPYCVGATIEVIVSADSFNAYVWGLNYSVSYDEDVVKFIDAENISSKFAYAFEFHNDARTGVVEFAANAADYTKINGGEDLVKLTFMVIDPDATETIFEVVNIDIVAYYLNEDSEQVNLEAAAGDAITVEIDKFLDVDGDEVAADMDDAFDLYNRFITGTAGYSACADADFDNDVDLDDLIILYQVIVGQTSIDAIVAAQLAK